MKAILESGMLCITPKDKEEENELIKWYKRTYESYDEMDDFMVYIEPVENDVVLDIVRLCECEPHTYYEWEKEENKCYVCNKMVFNPSEA